MSLVTDSILEAALTNLSGELDKKVDKASDKPCLALTVTSPIVFPPTSNSLQLSVTVSPSDTEDTITYGSLTPDLITVTSSGLVTRTSSNAYGWGQVKVVCGNQEDIININVKTDTGAIYLEEATWYTTDENDGVSSFMYSRNSIGNNNNKCAYNGRLQTLAANTKISLTKTDLRVHKLSVVYFTDNTVLDHITNTGGFLYNDVVIDSDITYGDYYNGERTYTCTTTQANGHLFIILDPTTEEVADGNITETYFNKCSSNLSIVVETLDNAPATTITYPTATTTTDGLMSSTDKSKLDGITAGAAVTDVQINNTSILSSGVANIPIADVNVLGAVKINPSFGIGIYGGALLINGASSDDIKAANNSTKLVPTYRQHEAVYYGLSKLAGVNLANETVTLGTYPETSKTAIRSMLVTKDSINNAGILNKSFETITNGEFTVTSVDNGATFGCSVDITSYNFDIDSGYYRITVNDTEYTLYSYRFVAPNTWNEFYCQALGNTNLMWNHQENTVLEYNYNVPFCIVDSNNQRLLFTETAGEYTIKIERQIQNAIQLPRELLRSSDNQLVYSKTNGPFNNLSIGQNSITTTSQGSIAIGFVNAVSGKNSLAIGVKNTASGGGVAVGGWGNTASGEDALATGLMCTASGDFSIVLSGVSNIASGERSVVSGQVSQATGYGSIAFGNHSISASTFQFVQGKYNIQDSNNTYAHIIGNGTSTTRSNAYALTWTGDGKYAGHVYVGAGTDSTGGTRLIEDVQINSTSIASNGIANIPIATTSVAGIMSATDKTKLDGITTMTGATSSTNGAAGLIPAPSSTDYEKFFRGDGTWQDGGRPMVILSYGSSTWSDFLEAYNHNVIVYARASSNSNPGTGVQGRMAFMAYLGLNSSGEPTNVEFQYYRSVSSHSATQMGDQVFIYKLDKTAGWSVTTREASIKQILVGADSNMSVSWSSNKVTINGTALPAVTAADNGKILQVVDGVWTAVTPS